MLASSWNRIEASLAPDAVVLDVGGWAAPLARADWVIDLMPHASRARGTAEERFSEATWVTRARPLAWQIRNRRLSPPHGTWR